MNPHDSPPPPPSTPTAPSQPLSALLLRHPGWQILLLLGLWWVGAALAALAGQPQLGSVAGMGVLLLLLATRRLRLERVRAGAGWLLTHMLLFFVPAVLVLLDHRELLGWTGLKVVLIIVVGTVLVMAGTALSIEWCIRWQQRHAERHPS